MIGMSLSYKKLLAPDGEELQLSVLLPRLWERGVRSVELRTVSPSASPDDVLRVANLLWDHGFQITVHGAVHEAVSAVEDVFGPLRRILAQLRQRALTVTIHPIVGDNVAMLTALSDHVIEQGYPVRIALENNRRMPDKTDGDSVALVLDAVTRTGRENVGICFDMGHFAWYAANFTDTPNMLPPVEFFRRIIHTHIHAYAEGTTHFPLEEWREPFSAYIEEVAERFVGVYNLELEPRRFAHRMSAAEGYLRSVDTLKAHYPSRAAYNDELRAEYDACFRRSLSVLDKKDGCYGTLLAPSAYLFSTNGYSWAMDLSFLELYELAESPSRVRDYLGGLDCILLTHGHNDHLEKRTVRALADTQIRWVVPDFLIERVLSYGVRRERLISVRAGDSLQVGPLRIRVLEGRHFRPGTNDGLEAVGYIVSVEQGPTLAFPGDVRDYGTDGVEQMEADHCFAHVWLTDHALTPSLYRPKSEEMAEFMLRYSRKSILLTHLHCCRHGRRRWTEHHACVVREEILRRSPETRVHIPRYGEIRKLSDS